MVPPRKDPLYGASKASPEHQTERWWRRSWLRKRQHFYPVASELYPYWKHWLSELVV